MPVCLDFLVSMSSFPQYNPRFPLMSLMFQIEDAWYGDDSCFLICFSVFVSMYNDFNAGKLVREKPQPQWRMRQ